MTTGGYKFAGLGGGLQAHFSQQADKVIVTIQFESIKDAYDAMMECHRSNKEYGEIVLRFPALGKVEQ